MAQQIINIGVSPDDGTGEPLRDAFQAVNDNFTEIYNAGPVGSNIQINGNVITTAVLNANLVLKPNGIGIIQANSAIIPSIDNVYDLGSPAKRFDTVYSNYFIGNGALLTGISISSGTKITNGLSNVEIAVANGNITVGVAGNNIAEFSNSGLEVNGNISGNYFLGNGALLTGVVTSTSSINNGNSNVAITTANGNVTITVDGVPNVVTVGSTQITVNGVIATPRVLAANIEISENVSAMMVSPLTIPDGLEITVPSSSVFNIIP
jgi:hypothetical protein